MNRKLITNMDTDENNDLSAVNMITLKKFHPDVPEHTHEVTKNIDLKELFNVVKSKQQPYSNLILNYDNLVSYNDVKNIFLSREETFPMKVGLDMGNNSIFNVKTPTAIDHGVNKGYVDTKTSDNRTKILNNTESISNTYSLLQSKKADKTYVDTKFNDNKTNIDFNTYSINQKAD